MTESNYNKIDINFIKECFEYNHSNGDIVWKQRPRNHFDSDKSYNIVNGKYSGKKAGSLFDRNKSPYIRIKIRNINILGHRIAWAIHYGYWPNQIDHINGDTLDNRISNLRNVTHTGNMRNLKKYASNSSGIVGVCFYKNNNKWGCRISNNSKSIFLGLYDDFFEACCCRKSAEHKYGYHINHGR